MKVLSCFLEAALKPRPWVTEPEIKEVILLQLK